MKKEYSSFIHFVLGSFIYDNSFRTFLFFRIYIFFVAFTININYLKFYDLEYIFFQLGHSCKNKKKKIIIIIAINDENGIIASRRWTRSLRRYKQRDRDYFPRCAGSRRVFHNPGKKEEKSEEGNSLSIYLQHSYTTVLRDPRPATTLIRPSGIWRPSTSILPTSRYIYCS